MGPAIARCAAESKSNSGRPEADPAIRRGRICKASFLMINALLVYARAYSGKPSTRASTRLGLRRGQDE
jgi:hypothetical protein